MVVQRDPGSFRQLEDANGHVGILMDVEVRDTAGTTKPFKHACTCHAAARAGSKNRGNADKVIKYVLDSVDVHDPVGVIDMQCQKPALQNARDAARCHIGDMFM